MDLTNSLFLQLAIVLGLASGIGLVIRLLKLPLLVAYLLAGVGLSLLRVFDLTNSYALTFLPEIGIAFVLFFIGMELDIKEIKQLGKPILVAGLGQILLSIAGGFALAALLGFKQTESLLMGVGLSFSSTIVVIKMLLEKKDLSSLYGKLSLGILLLEDLVAILLLMGMTVGSSVLHLGLQNSFPILTLVFKGVILIVTALFISKFVLNRLFTALAKSAELLFLSAVAWCFIFVSFSIYLGFSVVIGAFLAGVALANSQFHYEIQGKVKPLRDFFVTLFFVYLGTQVSFRYVLQVMPVILAFIAYALVFKPLIFLLILGEFGFRKHTIFQTAINLSQISEFSLIIMVIGLRLGLVSEPALTAMALIGVISIISSSIMIASSRQIYRELGPFMKFFEHGSSIHQAESSNLVDEFFDHVILIGAHRMGGQIIRFFKHQKIPFLVLDFNPKIIQKLTEQKINALYGDIGDPEILEFLNLGRAKLLISTAQDVDDNLMLLSEVKRRKIAAVVIARASNVQDAEVFYQAGADFVIMPEMISGDFVGEILKAHWPSLDYFKHRPEIELNKLSRNLLAAD